jgi:GR25 family glycosyltransferase involved in LPS biosynthesis
MINNNNSCNNIIIIYINLDFRTDRNKNVLNELKKIKNKIVVKISGVLLCDDNSKKYESYYSGRLSKEHGFIDNNNNILKKGIVGCYISHIKCIEFIIKYKNIIKEDYIVILEDDIKINSNNLKKDIDNNIKLIPDNWDLIRMDTWDYSKKKDKISNNIYQVSLPSYIDNKYFYHGAHMIVYNKHRINKIYNEIRRLEHGICDFDGLLCKCNLNHYVINKNMTSINSNYGSNTSINSNT